MRPYFLSILAVPLALCVAGCASIGEGAGLSRSGEGVPKAADILRDLAENDARIHTFRAAGSFTIESPEFDAVRKFRGGRIMFRRPADLYVQGNHRITNMTLFKLISVGDEFLMEFPTRKEESFYQMEGEQFEDVPFTVSPSDISIDMFLPEAWSELGRFKVRLVDYDPQQGLATLEIGPRKTPRRRIQVTHLEASVPRWVVVRNERLHEDGSVLALTVLGNYREIDGIVFPAEVDAWFPTEATRMRFEMRNIKLNVELPEDAFDLRGRAEELGLLKRSAE